MIWVGVMGFLAGALLGSMGVVALLVADDMKRGANDR